MKRYSINILSGILLALAMLTGFNWFINPYDVFSSPSFEGVNSYKSEVERYTRLSKVYKIQRVKPGVMLLASSRGLVIPDSYLDESGVSGFNMSLASASTYELLRVLQHAQAIHPLKKVILALDEEFSGAKKVNFSEERLAVNFDGSVNELLLKQKWKDMFLSLLSFDAFRSSLRTVRKQSADPENSNKNGYRSQRVAKAGGHRQMFRTMESSIFNKYAVFENKCIGGINNGLKPDDSAINYFEQIVDFAYANNIEMIIYFSPVHARIYEVKCMVGLWGSMERMKRNVVKTVDQISKSYGRPAFNIWDFSGYNSITTEDVPEIGDRTSVMKWYWEGSHYTEETARLILDTIMGKGNGRKDFGPLLTKENIEKHLLDINMQKKKYMSTHIEDIKELNELLDISFRNQP